MAEKSIALVTGVGPGTGAAIVRRFASDGFRVIALARSADLISVLERKLPDTHAAQRDVSDEGQAPLPTSRRRSFATWMRRPPKGTMKPQVPVLPRQS
jgi:NADP-dependent 3-hydroxy acid dehydrogenase YdfG